MYCVMRPAAARARAHKAPCVARLAPRRLFLPTTKRGSGVCVGAQHVAAAMSVPVSLPGASSTRCPPLFPHTPKLGSERVERSRYKMTMENAIQDCARVCRIRAAEERRYKVRQNIQTFGSLQKI